MLPLSDGGVVLFVTSAYCGGIFAWSAGWPNTGGLSTALKSRANSYSDVCVWNSGLCFQ